jgi:hypothetical protein
VLDGCQWGGLCGVARGGTLPPATTGTYAEASHPLTLKSYSSLFCKSLSSVQLCLIAFVNARPDAWPAFRILAISASLLMARRSFMRGFREWILFEGSRPARPSSLVFELGRKRDRKVVGGDFRSMSVYTEEAEETMGGRMVERCFISPV